MNKSIGYETELARSNWRQGLKEDLARHDDRLFECPECGLIWKEPIIPGNTFVCPGGCQDNKFVEYTG